MIPKIIWCTWKDEHVPDDMAAYMATWVEVLPDYEVRLLTDADIPSSPCTDAMRKQGKYVNAAQYMCWQQLYTHGGIYMDLDMEVLKSFDDLLDADAFIGIEKDGNKATSQPHQLWIACGVIGAKPEHPFIYEVLEYMDGFDFTHPRVENELGPRMFTKLLSQHGWKRANVDSTVAGVKILNNKVFYPYGWQHEYTPECVTEDTYAVHHWAYTWKHKTSVVIPCFNQAAYLSEAVDSALAQTEPPLEIIVVNDGSTDNSREVAKRYGDKITYIRHNKNKGASAARNTGIRAAKGHRIVCLDADDCLKPDYIKRLSDKGDISTCPCQLFGAQNGVWMPPKHNPTLADFVKANNAIAGSLFSRAVWEKIGGYDEKMRDGLEDWDFWVRAVAAGFSVTVTPEPMFEYRTYDYNRAALPGTWDRAKSRYSEVIAYMHAKWTKLGIPLPPPPPPLSYPVTLAVTVACDGVVYEQGTRLDRDTAVMLKKAGLLKDERIV